LQVDKNNVSMALAGAGAPGGISGQFENAVGGSVKGLFAGELIFAISDNNVFLCDHGLQFVCPEDRDKHGGGRECAIGGPVRGIDHVYVITELNQVPSSICSEFIEVRIDFDKLIGAGS